MASVWTALLIEAGAAVAVSASLTMWARKRFTSRDAVQVVETETAEAPAAV